MKSLHKIKEIVLDIIFPPLCVICNAFLENKEIPLICKNCLNKIVINNSTFCPICQKRLPSPLFKCHHSKKISYILAPAANYTDDIIKNLIKIYKYDSYRSAAIPLSHIVINYINKISLLKDFNKENSIIIPIPLHPKKERLRSFNQSELIAQIISQKFDIPIHKSLIKNKKTKPNARLKNKEERKANIAGSFSIQNSESILQKNVILIDDIHTTGATMTEAVKTLKLYGTKKIIALVIAKA